VSVASMDFLLCIWRKAISKNKFCCHYCHAIEAINLLVYSKIDGMLKMTAN